jgi:transcriptional regulator with XRE-family HTH domain
MRHSANMTARTLRTADYSQDARERLGAAVAAARTALGFKFRPGFAKDAGVSLRSLADIERGKPGVGEANLLTVARALPGWTEDTPREILEGGPVPPAVRRSKRPSETPPPREWSAASRARMGAMSGEEILDQARDFIATSGETAAMWWVADVARIKAEALSISLSEDEDVR